MFVEYSICKLISNAIICFKKHPRMQNQNPVLHFQKFHQKMKTLCRNSEVHHHQRQAKCIFFSRINIILHKAFIKPAQAQDSQVHAQAQGSQESRDFFGTHRPKILKNPKIFLELSGKTLTKFQKIPGFLGILGLRTNPALCSSGFLGILGLCMNPALCSSGFLGILGLCKFCSLQSFQCQNFHFKISTDLSLDTSKKYNCG